MILFLDFRSFLLECYFGLCLHLSLEDSDQVLALLVGYLVGVQLDLILAIAAALILYLEAEKIEVVPY